MTTGLDRATSATRRGMRAVISLFALVLLVGGIPVLLTQLGAALPLDVGALAPSAWVRADDGRALLLILLITAWASWAVMTASVVLEVLAVLRRVPAPALPGLAVPQRWAASLVAAVLLAMTSSAGLGAPAVATAAGGVPGLSSAVAASVAASGFVNPGVVAPAHSSPSSMGSSTHEAQRVAQSTRAPRSSPVVTTVRHDTLWLLAEQHLGSGERFVEIVALNLGVPQPDGRALSDDGRLYPGWILTLPADARTDAPRPDRHRVVRGDTLWQIAEAELGDPTRFDQIAALNEGDLQPDGQELTDPDLILPGWVLELPDDGGVAEPDSEGAGPAGSGPDLDSSERGELDQSGGSADSPQDPGAGAADNEPSGSAHVPNLERGGVEQPPGLGPSGMGPDHPDLERGATDDAPDLERGIDESALAESKYSDLGGPAKESTAAPARAAALPAATSAPAPSDPARAPDAPAPASEAPTPDAAGRADRGLTVAAGGAPGVTPIAGAAMSPQLTPARRDLELAPSSEALLSLEPETASFSLPAGGALGALVLLGFGAELVRRRQQFQRHRQPGELMAQPSHAARDIEAAARDAAHDASPDLITRSLTQLAAESARTGQPMPDVRLVRSTQQSVTLDLATPVGNVLAPFRLVDPSRWTLDPSLLGVELPTGAHDLPAALPGFVTLGFSGDETILLNLESVGTLAVTGPAGVVADVLRGFVAELALGPASRSTERVLCVGDARISAALEPGAVDLDVDAVRVGAALRSTIGRTRSRASAAGRPQSHGELMGLRRPVGVTAPAEQAPRDGWPAGLSERDPLLVVLCDVALDVHVPPNTGCALITTASADAGATLVVQPEGRAQLLPERQVLSPQSLSARSAEHVASALECADLPTTTAPPGEASERVNTRADRRTPDGIGLRESAHSDREARRPGAETVLDVGPKTPAASPADSSARGGGARRSAEMADPVGSRAMSVPASSAPSGEPMLNPAPRVLLLGEILVEHAHGAAESTRLGRLAETAAFVTLNPDARLSELQSALWPGRRSNPQTCRQMVSRARTWLGRTDQGESYLMPLSQSEGRLRLRAEVESDWDEFQQLAALGLADPTDTAHLTDALALVRGRPFGAVASRELPWADLHINHMISLITDVAHALAIRHEQAGRFAAAGEAALRGLQTESQAQMLEEIVARVSR